MWRLIIAIGPRKLMNFYVPLDSVLQAPVDDACALSFCFCSIYRVKGAEARRRIKFFVNSLFIEQPKPKRVLQMPSLTTLTPYYNEDVVSITAAGLLRSISEFY